MANEQLLAALMGVNYSPLETPYGMGATTVARAVPSLYNPYANVGTNLGVTLGGALVAGLLGYQARQQAREQNLALQPLVGQAFKATTPEQLQAVTAQPGGERLTDLVNQLYLQQIANTQTQAQRDRELDIELLKAGYMPTSLKGRLPEIAPATISGEVAPELQGLSEMGLLPKAARDIEQKVVEQRLLKAPERLNDERRALQKTGENATQIANMYDSIELLMGQNSLAADAEIARLGTKIGDPTSIVSPSEARARVAVLPKLEQYKRELNSVISGESKLTDEARADLLRAFKPYVQAAKDTYASQYELSKKRLETEKIIKPNDPEAATKLLPFPIPQTSGSQKAFERLQQIKSEIASGAKTVQDIESLKKEANDLAQIYGPVWRVIGVK